MSSATEARNWLYQRLKDRQIHQASHLRKEADQQGISPQALRLARRMLSVQVVWAWHFVNDQQRLVTV